MEDTFRRPQVTEEKHVDELPTEILEDIFKYLRGSDTVNCCRLVSRKWKNAVDTLKDSTWRIYCIEKFNNAQNDFNSTKLTWKQLYRSLTLWSKVNKAEVTIRHEFCKNLRQGFMSVHSILTAQNQLIGIPAADPSCDSYTALKSAGLSNSIVYHDVITLKEHHREVFSVNFSFCKENSNFYVFASNLSLDDIYKLNAPFNVNIVTKINNKLLTVGKIKNIRSAEQITLIDDKVCYVNDHNRIIIARLRHGEVIIEASQRPLDEEVVTFSFYKDQLYILTLEDKVYSFVNQDCVELATIECCEIRATLQKLTDYGFKWDSPRVLSWLSAKIECEMFENPYTACGQMLIFVPSQNYNILSFYHNPFDSNGYMNISYDRCTKSMSVKPHRTLYLDALAQFLTKWERIVQLHSICTEKGHRIFLLTNERLHVLDLNNTEDCHEKVPFQNTISNTRLTASKHVEDLPDRTLQTIFKYLCGRDAANCARVSKKWRDNIESLNDSVWREYCEKEFHNAQDDFMKANLTWKQLYKSLSLWPRAQSADIAGRTLCKTKCDNFVIRNGIIGVPFLNIKEPNSVDTSLLFWNGERKITTNGISNSIVYYDIKSLSECHRETFDFNFIYYKETNDFIAFVGPPRDQSSKYIIPHLKRPMKQSLRRIVGI